jgi:hypothetical protein
MPQLGAPLWICVDKEAIGNQQLVLGRQPVPMHLLSLS